MSKKYTKLKKFKIEKFRGLKDIDVEFGNSITLICGKNGTSKSTILGMAAQIFSFSADHSCIPPKPLKYKTLTDKNFKSEFSEHFRFSKEFDKSGSMELSIELYDAYFRKYLDELELGVYYSEDRDKVRPVVRKNVPALTGKGNRDRNVTHPVIYLNLSRLMPISQRQEYSQRNIKYLDDNFNRFKSLCSNIIGRQDLTKVTATDGDVKSAVSHSNHYDQDSVSVGEDNVGQVALAIMSFEKLKEEYDDFKGGLLLIDEADAGLFPSAQERLIDELTKVTRKIGLQVIMTSHSPTMIEYVKSKSDKDKQGNFKTIYLTDSYGKIQAMEDWGWGRIHADLHNRLYNFSQEGFVKPFVYFEDKEANDFYLAIIKSRKLKGSVKMVKDITLGCGNYLNLIEHKIKEFAIKSVIVFDGDVEGIKESYKNCVKLPGVLPPDQLLFEHLFKLPDNAPFYVNHSKQFTKRIFEVAASEIYRVLEIDSSMADEDFVLKDLIDAYNPNGGRAIREVFKDFYQDPTIQSIVTSRKNADNPFFNWSLNHTSEIEKFRSDFAEAIRFVLNKGYGVNRAELTVINP